MPLVVKGDGRYVHMLACKALQDICIYLITLDTLLYLKQFGT